jgi:hypothetical protein
MGASISPFTVQKGSGYLWFFDEDFTTTTYMDFANSTVRGWEQGAGMVSLPRTFPRIGSEGLNSYSNGFTVKDQYAYIAGDPFGLEILDISDPKQPQHMNQFSFLNSCVDVVAGNEYLYLTSYYFLDIDDISSYFTVLDVSDPINPVMLNSLANLPNSTHITFMADMVFSADENWIFVLNYVLDSAFQLTYSVTSLNISVPTSPSVSSTCVIPVPSSIEWSFDNELFISGDYLYLPDGYNGFSILDVSDPTNINSVINYVTGGKPVSVYVEQDIAYFVDLDLGLQVFDVTSPSNPLPLTIVPTSPKPHAIWVEDNVAYVAYSSGGLGGLQVFNVQDPLNPALIGSTSILGDFFSIFKDNGLPYYPHDDYILICGSTFEVFDAVHYESVAVAQSTTIVSTLGSAFFYMVDFTPSTSNIILEENTAVEFHFSPDAGLHWEQANLAGGFAHQFTLLGSQLRWKAILRSTDGEGTPIIGPLTFECYIYIKAPSLLSPDDGYSTFNNRPTLEWENLPDAMRYYLQIDRSSNFNSSDLFTIWIDEPVSSFTIQNDLSSGTWYWRVAAIDMDNEFNPFTRYSVTRSVLIDIINQPTDINYISGSLGHYIIWNPVSSNPASFQVYRDGTWVAGGLWDGDPITIGVDDLPAGLHNYTCTAYELSGDEVSDTVSVNVTEYCKVIIDSPSPITYSTDTITVGLSGDAEYYWYSIEGVDSVNQTWTSTTLRTLVDGSYVFHAYGNDSAGNEVHKSINFIIDTTPPLIVITSPIPTTYPSSVVSISLNGYAEFFWYNIETIDIINHSWSSTIIRTFPDGTYTLNAYGNDSVGNVAHTISIFTIDTAPPIIDHPLAIISEEGNFSSTIVWTPVDINPSSFLVTRDSTQVISGPWNGEPIKISLYDLPPGTYQYTCTVYDMLGNTANDTVTVTIISVQDTLTTSTPFTSIPTTSPKSESTTGTTTVRAEPGSHPPLFMVIFFLCSLSIFTRKQRRT